MRHTLAVPMITSLLYLVGCATGNTATSGGAGGAGGNDASGGAPATTASSSTSAAAGGGAGGSTTTATSSGSTTTTGASTTTTSGSTTATGGGVVGSPDPACLCLAHLYLTPSQGCTNCVGSTVGPGAVCGQENDACLAEPECFPARKECLHACVSNAAPAEMAACFAECIVEMPGDTQAVVKGKQVYRASASCFCDACAGSCPYPGPFACYPP